MSLARVYFLKIGEWELLFGHFHRLVMELGVLCDSFCELHKAHEWPTLPVRAVRKQHWHSLVRHVVWIIGPNQVDDASLLLRLNIDVVVCIVDADILVPQHHCEHPVAAVPAGRLVEFLIELPLATAWLEFLVTKYARDGQVLLVATKHVDLLLVYDLRSLPQLHNLAGFLLQPTFVVSCLVVTDLYLIWCQCLSFFEGQRLFKVIAISLNVNDYIVLLGCDG